jgi:hypothetical protein
MSQAVLIELIKLSSMYLKANKVSLVAIGTHSERPIEILTSSRRADLSDDFTDNAQVRSLLVVRGVFKALQVHHSMYQRLRKHPGQPFYTLLAPSTRSDDRPTAGATQAS